MKILLDTCALLWWWGEPEKLSPRALFLLRDPENQFSVSPASAWEIATKHRIGKFPGGVRIISQWAERLQADGFRELPITCAHSLCAGGLSGEHRDPFDRMISAQGILETLPILTNDIEFENLGAARIW